MVTKETIAEMVACGPDPDRHREAIQEYVDAGFDRIYVHQVGQIKTASCASMNVRSCPRSRDGA